MICWTSHIVIGPENGGRSTDQITAALREHEAGVPAAEFCRKLGIAGNTFYRWKSKYGGMDVSEARRLKELEDENSRR